MPLSTYMGPMTITTPRTIIDAPTMTKDPAIKDANVKITRSLINGSVATNKNSTGYSFSVAGSVGFCTDGGSSAGKPYTYAHDIKFANNV